MTVKNESQFTVLLGGPYNQLDFTEFSGGEISREAERYPEGLKDEMGFTVGITQVGDITLRVPYNPDIHDIVIEKFQRFCGEAIEIVVQPIKICPERQPDGRSRTYYGCVPISIAPPEVNRGGSGNSMLSMTFATRGMRLG